MQVMGLEGRALVVSVLLIGVLAAQAGAESSTTVPAVALDAAPVSFDAVIEPETSLQGTLAVNGEGINRGVLRLVVDGDTPVLVQLTIDGSDTQIRGVNAVEGPWGCLQTSSCGGRVRYRIDALAPVAVATTVQVTVEAQARDETFEDGADVRVEPEASSLVEPGARVVAGTGLAFDSEQPVGAVIVEWDFVAPPGGWELIFLTDPAIGLGAPRPLAAGGPVSTTPVDVIVDSRDDCPDGRCVGRAVQQFGPDIASTVPEFDVYAVLLGPDPTESEPMNLRIRNAPIATASGSVVLDSTAPDVLIPVFVGAEGPQQFDVYAFVQVTDVRGDLYEPVSLALDQPGPDRSWRTQVAEIAERRPDALAEYELALASRPAYRGDATVTARWTVVAVATPYEDVPIVTDLEVRTGDPARVTFVPGEPGDPTRPLESSWWEWVWRIALSAAALVAAAAAAVVIWRRGIRVRRPVD
jgi:hypothetical protein